MHSLFAYLIVNILYFVLRNQTVIQGKHIFIYACHKIIFSDLVIHLTISFSNTIQLFLYFQLSKSSGQSTKHTTVSILWLMKCSGGIFTHYLASKAKALITISVSTWPAARLLEALKLCRVRCCLLSGSHLSVEFSKLA